MDQNNQEYMKNALRTMHGVFRLQYLYSHHLFEKIGIYPGQHVLLRAIGEQEGRNLKELADLISVKPATVTVMVKRMERAGLLYRQPCLSDKRAFGVYLTELGKEKMESLKDVFDQLEQKCFANFTKEELKECIKVLSKVEHNLLEEIQIHS
jgi:DNA-binding MarR family transcriptional regulator